MRNESIGIGIFIPLLGLVIPWFIRFIRSHYLYSELKDTEIIFLSLERRFQLETTILLTIIIANFAVLFIALIIFKITGWFVLIATVLDLIMFIIGEVIVIIRQNKYPKEIQITINKVNYTLLHRIDNKYISAHPTLNKDDGSIVLLSMDEIKNHRISLKSNKK